MFTSPRRARVARPVLAALVAAALVGLQPPGAAAQDAPPARPSDPYGGGDPYGGPAKNPYANPSAPSAPAAAAAASDPKLVTRVYPVGPLLASVSWSAARGETDLLQQTIFAVAGDTWQANGGRYGTLRFFGDKMIVTNTPEVQKQVADLLSAMQGNHVVTVRAMLVQADDAKVRQMTEIADGVTLLNGEPDDLPTVAQVRYSGFEGRAQHAGDGRSVPYPASVTPVVATGAVGYNVTYGNIETGLSLDVTPTLEPGGGGVLLDVDAQYVLVDQADAAKGEEAPAAAEPTPATRPANPYGGDPYGANPYGGRSPYGRVETGRSDPAPAPAPVAVDRMAIKTSLRAPTGRWILVGSLGSSRDGEPTDQPPMHLLLRVDAK